MYSKSKENINDLNEQTSSPARKVRTDYIDVKRFNKPLNHNSPFWLNGKSPVGNDSEKPLTVPLEPEKLTSTNILKKQ